MSKHTRRTIVKYFHVSGNHVVVWRWAICYRGPDGLTRFECDADGRTRLFNTQPSTVGPV